MGTRILSVVLASLCPRSAWTVRMQSLSSRCVGKDWRKLCKWPGRSIPLHDRALHRFRDKSPISLMPALSQATVPSSALALYLSGQLQGKHDFIRRISAQLSPSKDCHCERSKAISALISILESNVGLRIHVIPAEAGIQKGLGPGFRRDDEYGHSGRTLEKCYRGSLSL